MAYPWPLEPFDQQHPVRGFFRDPRIGDDGGSSFHTGVDIVGPDGTAVYAVAPGRVSIEGTRIVAVAQDGRDFGYWHIVPAVKGGDRVALHALLGHIAPGWGHVHLAERTPDPPPRGAYWNPFRRGALTPYSDFGAPVVARIVSSVPVEATYGAIDLVVETFDHPPIAAPPPWRDLPVTPALLRWRLLRSAKVVVPWTVSTDFRRSFLPHVVGESDIHFGDIYAPGTRQNHPNKPGLYRLWLVRRFDTNRHPDGQYRLEVEASDVRGNASRAHVLLNFVNQQRNV